LTRNKQPAKTTDKKVSMLKDKPRSNHVGSTKNAQKSLKNLTYYGIIKGKGENENNIRKRIYKNLGNG